MFRLVVIAVITAFIGLCTSVARADPAAAQKLFEEAVALRDSGAWPEACRKFVASLKLDASVGTLLNVAQCDAREGRLATALTGYERARVMNQSTPDAARKQGIDDHIASSVAALRPRVPLLAITVSPMVDGVVVTRAGEVVPIEALGEELPVDPGEVVVQAQAPGYAGEVRIRIAERERQRVVVTMQPTTTTQPQPVLPQPVARRNTAVPVWAWVSGGVGLAFAGAAVGMAVWYASTVDEINERCGGQPIPCVPVDDYDPSSDNKTKNLALGLGVAFGVVGGAGVVAAIVGIATTPSESEVSVVDHPGGVGIAVRF